MGESVKILSKSSSGNPYTVTFFLEENTISAFCSCPAGEHRKLCKHVLQMLDSNDSILYDSSQKPILARISSHLQSTSIPPLLSGLCDKETLLKKMQDEVKKAKKSIEKILLHK